MLYVLLDGTKTAYILWVLLQQHVSHLVSVCAQMLGHVSLRDRCLQCRRQELAW